MDKVEVWCPSKEQQQLCEQFLALCAGHKLADIETALSAVKQVLTATVVAPEGLKSWSFQGVPAPTQQI